MRTVYPGVSLTPRQPDSNERSEALERRKWIGDHPRRNACQIVSKTAFGLEAFAKQRGIEIAPPLTDDAAREVYAAPSA
jgi:hypothetical protein